METEKNIQENARYNDLIARYEFEKRVQKRLKTFAAVMAAAAAIILCCLSLCYKIPYMISIYTALSCWVLALISYFAGKKYKPVAALNAVFNSVAIGLAVSAFFNYKNYLPGIELLGFFSAGFLAVSAVFWLLVNLLPFKKTLTIAIIILPVAAGIYSAISYKSNPELYSLVLFMSIFYFGNALAFGYYAFVPDSKFWNCVYIGLSFVAVIIIAVVLFIVSEGDFDFNFYDLGFEPKDKLRKKKPK
ncbi:MAG TPA: hypothetical protein VIL23_01960 [Clostridia bacterium]